MSATTAAAALLASFQQIDQVDEHNGCVIRIGQALEGGVQPLLAECHWTDVTAADVRAVLSRYDGYGRFIDVIKESRIVDADSVHALVWHFSKPGYGLAPRESQVWMEPAAGRAWTMAWVAAAERFVPRPGSIVMPRNEGIWTLAPASDGGVDITQVVLVDPGGSVPTFVVNWFQTCGMKEALGRLRSLAQAVTP